MNQLDIVKYFVEQTNCNLNLRYGDWTTLTWAVDCGNLSILEYLVKTGKFDVNEKEEYGDNVAQYAIRSVEWNSLEYLLDGIPELKGVLNLLARNDEGKDALDMCIDFKRKGRGYYGDPLTDDEKPKLDKCILILKKARVDWFVTFACCLGGEFPEIPLRLVYEFCDVVPRD